MRPEVARQTSCPNCGGDLAPALQAPAADAATAFDDEPTGAPVAPGPHEPPAPAVAPPPTEPAAPDVSAWLDDDEAEAEAAPVPADTGPPVDWSEPAGPPASRERWLPHFDELPKTAEEAAKRALEQRAYERQLQDEGLQQRLIDAYDPEQDPDKRDPRQMAIFALVSLAVMAAILLLPVDDWINAVTTSVASIPQGDLPRWWPVLDYASAVLIQLPAAVVAIALALNVKNPDYGLDLEAFVQSIAGGLMLFAPYIFLIVVPVPFPWSLMLYAIALVLVVVQYELDGFSLFALLLLWTLVGTVAHYLREAGLSMLALLLGLA